MKRLSTIKTFLFGLLGGLLGAFLMFQVASQPLMSSQAGSSGTGVSKVAYQNTSSTTEAVAKVQNAVVSVLNYQKTNGDTNLSNFYAQIFGNNDSTNNQSSNDLAVAGEGSGVIYKKDNKTAYIVTNTHVVEGAERIEILLSDGTKVVGELVGQDTYSDIAVVKISSDTVETVAEFADSETLTVGETAIAIGSPLGSEYANSVTQGIVSSLSRTVTLSNTNGETISTNAIQTDAAINPGNSGGALVNTQGQVIGINSSKISSTSSSGETVEGMGFAIPSNDVVKIINQLEATGEVTRPALGISMASLNSLSASATSQLNLPNDVTNGVVVASVQNGMPADGVLEKYDVITAIDDQEVDSVADLQSALYGHNINDSINITFYRGNQKQTKSITLTKTSKELENNN